MTTPAGTKTCKIAIQRRTGAVDTANQPLDEWENVFPPIWAQPRSATGMAAVRAAQEGVAVSPSKVSWRINFRNVGIDNSMRVLHIEFGIAYDIRDIRHDLERRQWTDLVCETGGNNG